MDNADVYTAGLLGRVWGRLVRVEGIAETNANISTLGLVGGLLTGPLALGRDLYVLIAAVGGEGGGHRSWQGGRVGTVARQDGACGIVRVRGEVLDVVTQGSVCVRVVRSSPLPRRLLVGNIGVVCGWRHAYGSRRMTVSGAVAGAVGGAVGGDVGDSAARVGLGLGGIVNDNDLSRQAVAVEIIPVGFVRATTFPRG